MKTEGKSRVSGMQAQEFEGFFIRELNDIYSTARFYRMTHEAIRALVKERLYDNPRWLRLSGSRQSYVEGYYRALRDTIWNELVWMLWCDGELRTSKEVEALPVGESGCSGWSRIDSDKSRHVWKDKNGNPLRDKPF